MHNPPRQLPTKPPRILLAASGTPASRHAAATAADLATAFDAELTILHVLPACEYRAVRLGPILPINRQLDDPLRSEVLLDARRVAWNRGIASRTILIAGDPAAGIVAVATDISADLLVIGKRRRRLPLAGAARTHTWVQAHAPCPVLPVSIDSAQPSQRQLEPRLAI